MTRTAEGRPVVYMTEARRDGFLYRFVAATGPDGEGLAANGALLDEGALSVARVEGSTIRWLRLPATAAALIEARAAAEQAGATPFDSPSGLAVAPDGRLFLACRGAERTPARLDSLNPRPINPWGHVVEIIPDNRDHGADAASGAVLLLGGDPAQAGSTARYGAGSRVWLAAPAVLEIDRRGRLFIGTAQGNLAAQRRGSPTASMSAAPRRVRHAERSLCSTPRRARPPSAGFASHRTTPRSFPSCARRGRRRGQTSPGLRRAGPPSSRPCRRAPR
ncbi:MAG: DUF839 domain-containing protein [Acetobacteraceae bacterium]|nr:DUF839 domain-containing protein [Acetobacteraceae bacterium]